MKHFTLITAIAATIVLFTACETEKNVSSSELTVDVQESDVKDIIRVKKAGAGEFSKVEKENNTLKVKVGDTFEIALVANTTTGFNWENNNAVNKDVIKLEKIDYRSTSTTPFIVGVPGENIIIFKAIKNGTAEIDLTYMRPWEPNSDLNKKYKLTVEVE